MIKVNPNNNSQNTINVVFFFTVCSLWRVDTDVVIREERISREKKKILISLVCSQGYVAFFFADS